ALRRAGTGIIRAVLEKQLPVSLNAFSIWARGRIFPQGDVADSKSDTLMAVDVDVVDKEIADFLWQRAENWFGELGYANDEIQAVSENGLEDLLRTFKRLAAVHAMRPNAEFVTLAGTFKRAANILKQAKNGSDSHQVDSALLSQEGEKSLH